MEILLVRTNHPAMKQLADFVAEEKESLDEKLTPFAAASADFSLWPGTAELSKAPVFSRDSATSPAESVENFLDVDGLRLSSDSSVSALPDESDDFQPKSPALSLISEEGGEAPKEFRRDSYVEGLGSLFSRPAPPPPFRFSSFSLPPNFHFPFLEDSAKEEKIEQTKEEQQTTTEKNSFKGSFEAATSSDSVLFPTVSTDCSSSSPVQRFSLPSLFPFSRRHFSLVGPRIFPGSVTAAAFFQSFCVLLRSPESGQLYKIK